MCGILVILTCPKRDILGSGSGSRPASLRVGTFFLCPQCCGEDAGCVYCSGMAFSTRSRARWEEILDIQKRRLGKHLGNVDTKLSFDTFDLCLRDLEDNRTQHGLGRLLKPDVLNQIREFSAAITSASQASDVAALLWGSIQAILKARNERRQPQVGD